MPFQVAGAQVGSVARAHLPALRAWPQWLRVEADAVTLTAGPGESLSLQYHPHRAEHWTVVRAHGIVQIGDVQYPTGPGEYRYIPLKEKHRLTNTGQEELVLIEVQVGDYLGEDDIVRLQDNYGRA